MRTACKHIKLALMLLPPGALVAVSLCTFIWPEGSPVELPIVRVGGESGPSGLWIRVPCDTDAPLEAGTWIQFCYERNNLQVLMAHHLVDENETCLKLVKQVWHDERRGGRVDVVDGDNGDRWIRNPAGGELRSYSPSLPLFAFVSPADLPRPGVWFWTKHSRSLDARYLGPVAPSEIRQCLRPLLTY